MEKYIAPEFKKDGFNCPFCEAYTQQNWHQCLAAGTYQPLYIATCTKCYKDSIWHKEKMIYPALSTAPLAHPDMPELIKPDYQEARNILNVSPRGACALLRLAIQKLCDELVHEKADLNTKIAELVKRGLPSQLQKAFDFVRITGNDAVHGIGEINVEDNPEIANALFMLINMIVDKMITEPKKVDEFYNLIPDNKKIAIENRDS